MTIADTLAVLLPDRRATALLTAALHEGERAHEGWASWIAGRAADEASLCRELSATRTLLPLLARSAGVNQLPLAPGVLQYVRAAALREELRAERYRRIVARALTALDGDAAAALLLRGAALAGTVYAEWSHRHCHDLDLLVSPAELAGAARALAAAECVPAGPVPDGAGGAMLRHTSGLEVALHSRPFALRYYTVPVERFARGARLIRVEGARGRVPSPETSLVHVLGHASYSASRLNLRWAADAWHLASAGQGLDWDRVIGLTEEYRLMLPVSVLLAYLAGLGVGVPGEVLARARRGAAAAGWAAQDVALGAARLGSAGALPNLWRATPTWRGRACIARWAVAPSPEYLRASFALRRPWLYPLCYLYRPARFLARTLGRAGAP